MIFAVFDAWLLTQWINCIFIIYFTTYEWASNYHSAAYFSVSGCVCSLSVIIMIVAAVSEVTTFYLHFTVN